MHFIILLIISLFLIILFYKINYYNFFNNVLDNNKYLKNFNNLDYKLRKCNKKNCINIYNNYIIPFSENEKIFVNELKNNIQNIINNLFYKNIFIFDFLKSKNNMENSLPHTRNNFVILSQKWFDKFKKINNILDNEIYFKLMFHEIFHIFQRNNPKVINIFYTKYWNLIKYKKNIPIKLKKIIRTNPDALPNNNWLFKINDKQYILPLCIYNKNSNNISDTINVYYKLDGNHNFTDIDNFSLLNDLEEYNNYFGIYNSNNYHPNELSSSIFENIIYNLYLNTDYDYSHGMSNMIRFLREHSYLKN